AQESDRSPSPCHTSSQANETRRQQTTGNRPKAAEKQRNPGERRDQYPSRRLRSEEFPQNIPQPEHDPVLVKFQAASFFQISRQPGDVKEPSVRQAEVLHPEQPNGPR